MTCIIAEVSWVARVPRVPQAKVQKARGTLDTFGARDTLIFFDLLVASCFGHVYCKYLSCTDWYRAAPKSKSKDIKI